MASPHDNPLRRTAGRPVAAMLLAVALAAITSVDGTFGDAGGSRTALRDASSGTATVAAVIAAAVRDLAGRRAANVAGSTAGASTFLALLDVATGRVTGTATIARPPIDEAMAPQPAALPARLLALPPPLR